MDQEKARGRDRHGPATRHRHQASKPTPPLSPLPGDNTTYRSIPKPSPYLGLPPKPAASSSPIKASIMPSGSPPPNAAAALLPRILTCPPSAPPAADGGCDSKPRLAVVPACLAAVPSLSLSWLKGSVASCGVVRVVGLSPSSIE